MARTPTPPPPSFFSRILKVLPWITFILLIAIQFIPVDRSAPPAGVEVPAPPEVLKILRSSCYDCHSHQTVWPWYSAIAPVSWALAYHVREGRRELNFTQWDKYPPEKQKKKMKEIFEEVEEDKMPIKGYLLLHPEATLTAETKKRLLDWSRP